MSSSRRHTLLLLTSFLCNCCLSTSTITYDWNPQCASFSPGVSKVCRSLHCRSVQTAAPVTHVDELSTLKRRRGPRLREPVCGTFPRASRKQTHLHSWNYKVFFQRLLFTLLKAFFFVFLDAFQYYCCTPAHCFPTHSKWVSTPGRVT